MVEELLMENYGDGIAVCCVPGVCHVGEPVQTDDLSEAVKVICNNEHCQEGTFMHKLCFEQWQETVLTYLRSSGRARSWSEKQRMQNLWTKKGYDLAYKACGCKCGKGHLRKDLDWVPPPASRIDQAKKRKHRKKKNDKPSLYLSRNITQTKQMFPVGGQAVPIPRMRSSSISSSSSGSPTYSINDCPQSPVFSVNNHGAQLTKVQNRERNISGSLFCHRQDYSSFNLLPRHKINSYHIKMEDDRCQGNDEIRCFILSLFSMNKSNSIDCIFCETNMPIFDCYPLIDGTFFLSPLQHNNSAVAVSMDVCVYYLNAVCMNCLEGWNIIACRYCNSKWDGRDLILGTMYSYDVLAAKPCCVERLRCKNCAEVIFPENRLRYFSDYSHIVPCPRCNIADYHFVKPLHWYSHKN